MTDANSSPDAVIAKLSAGADKVIATSCAVVVLKDDQAFKIKKSVDYGFLNFTSQPRRREALERELKFNQRTAADVYREVIEVDGEAVLVMRRFDQSMVLAEQSLSDPDWSPNIDLMQTLGEVIADFHAGSEVCRDPSHAANIKYVIDSNRSNIDVFRQHLGAARVEDYDQRISQAYEQVKSVVQDRFDEGFVRRCHGDLHLGNIFVEMDRPVLFDCIEFNERLSQIDVLYDLAFLLMDLWVRGHKQAANRVMNAYMDKAARNEADDGRLYSGLKLLPLYMSVRAGVRCHVNAHYGDLEQASVYLDAAMAFLEMDKAGLMAVGGLSGSGKTTYARRIADSKGRSPGAVILRSDEIRKRLWDWPSFERLPAEAYTHEETDKVYSHIKRLAGIVLASGQSVILDATFRDLSPREAMEALAETTSVHFEGIWLDLSREERVRRVAVRSNDASDATEAVADSQAEVKDLSSKWTRIEAI
ncbi:bifunctional aminoglycoside phosphotransferase/ATP-binding protein [Asticcacaulis endophyticus]|uniref:Aminoglycoside phosphotransferase domain-containing protein n=1 Tax=Asticcacaulis endophyticus TaxID=1395890 RepID=A0A918QBS0_9CAUL|nr:bifunctional aminoglycoside phosphotransferase/ATP-binding protein [Asticcacaulis endophyticus]GGZ41181.1 hypothetical protein GCM10011273_29940 [Asticcacaulis endophyticus]